MFLSFVAAGVCADIEGLTFGRLCCDRAEVRLNLDGERAESGVFSLSFERVGLRTRLERLTRRYSGILELFEGDMYGAVSLAAAELVAAADLPGVDPVLVV